MRRRPFATFLVGSSALLRAGLALILSAAEFRVVASASCVDDLPPDLLAQDRSVLLIIDASDDIKRAISQIQQFREKSRCGRTVVVAGHPRLCDMASMIHAGANACFVAATDSETFIKSVELVMLGETILPASFVDSIHNYEDDCDHKLNTIEAGGSAGSSTQAESDGASKLSGRERRILYYLSKGDTNKVIARTLDITEATVKVHLKAILRKIGVRNRTQAAVWAMNNGLVMPPIDGGSPKPMKAIFKEQKNGSGALRVADKSGERGSMS